MISYNLEQLKTQLRYLTFISLLMVLTSCSSAVRFTQDGATSASVGGKLQAKQSVGSGQASSTSNPTIQIPKSDSKSFDIGLCSYYSDGLQGNSTASGEKYRKDEYTAAHRDLPFGTKVRVTNLKNQKTVYVTINDRGPFVRGRIIDVSRAAAEDLDMISAGVVEIELEVLN